ncbi:hypothetical protein PPERSA_10559 [Pseudocohnilembus persalinus]|uniref:Uncharacterized protein n=1 Tax=Pseudocohnilembus persalinus TaxID=266149 RepID=A0A0V0Q9Q1_PSEPJ|nr:hypothetical protein PPERSA_10559 [Pseudocohnilembus persalinus]|eukprot:KRW98788.1 hypothetical protein PPERSA_10559 [Pseudocohnilembus persalinus]
MLIFEFNGVLVSDHFVKIQIENLFTNKFLEYERIRIFYVQRQAKQAMQKPTDFFGFKLNQTSPDKLDFKGQIFARKLQEKFNKNQHQQQNQNQGVKNQQNEGKSGRQFSSLQSNKKNNLVDFELADEEDNKELYDKQMVLINFNNFLDKNKKEQEIHEKKIEEQEEKIKIFRKSQQIEDANFLFALFKEEDGLSQYGAFGFKREQVIKEDGQMELIGNYCYEKYGQKAGNFTELEELSLVLEKYQYGMEGLQGSKKMWENLKNVEFPYVQGLREKEKSQKLSVVKNIYDSKKFQILALIREYEKKKKKALKFEMKGRVQYFNPQNDYKNSTDEYDILVKQIEEAKNDLQIFKESNQEIFSELKKSNLGQIDAQKQNLSDEQKAQKSVQLDTSFEEVVDKFEKVIQNTKKKQNKYKIIIENELLQQTGKKLIQQNQTFNLNTNYNNQNQTQSIQQINRKQISYQQSQDFKQSQQQQSQQKQQLQKKNQEFEYRHENIKFEVYDGQGQLQNTQEQLQKQQEQQKLMNFNRNFKDTKLYKDNRRQYKNEHKGVIQSLVGVKQLTQKPQLEVVKHRNYDQYITEKVKDEFKQKKLQKIEHEKKLKEIEEKEQFQKLQDLQKKQDKLAQQQQFSFQNQNESEQEQNRLNQQLAIDLELYKQRQLAEQVKLEQLKEEEKLRQLREKGEKYRQFAEQTINKFEEVGQIQGEFVRRLQKIK